MAGIGFSINKIIREKDLSSKPRAYFYASVVTVGPMILGILVLMAVYALSFLSKINDHERNIITALITYAMLFSLIISSSLSMIVSRYISDTLNEKQFTKILPTYWGSNSVMLIIGGLIYGIFILLSGVDWHLGMLSWLLFCELIMTWNLMNFLSAIKDYMGIVKAFMVTILTTAIMGSLFLIIGWSKVTSLVYGLVLGYAAFIMLATVVLYRQFPKKVEREYLFSFLSYLDNYWQLSVINLAMQLGMVFHIMMMWHGPLGEQVIGLFYIAPYYDIAVLLAYLTTVITSIHFVISVEVNFFKQYQSFYRSLDSGANLRQIREVEDTLINTLRNELRRIAWSQTTMTLAAITIGVLVLQILPMGFASALIGIFRVLCIGYACAAIVNCILLIHIYFSDLVGAMRLAVTFALMTTLATALSFLGELRYFGLGFTLAAFLSVTVALSNLGNLLSNLLYQALGRQPIQFNHKVGLFSQLAIWLDKKLDLLVK